MAKVHASIREVDLLRSRIAELEDDVKEVFKAGWEFGVCAVSESRLPFPEDAETAYKNWIKERE